jgi:hypothetical protein
MTFDEPWIPPQTHELGTPDGRVLRYCLYGPTDGLPVIAIAARESYLRAARMTASVPEQRYLALRAARLHQFEPPADPAG